jgi:hypothetical protein
MNKKWLQIIQAHQHAIPCTHVTLDPEPEVTPQS